MKSPPRRVCFVTGTRAEFGLMRTTLLALSASHNLQLQIIATGMHLDPRHGDGVRSIRSAGFHIDKIVPWPADSGKNLTRHAAHTGLAMAGLARAFAKLQTDIVLVVGDRVEAFAAAAAAHLSGCILAHVHGGDRAAGQADDCLRHAISKLAHLHFPATKQSAERLVKMGEDRWRIHRCGSPGVDGIRRDAATWKELSREFTGLGRCRYALVVLHPVDADDQLEAQRTRDLFDAVLSSPVDRVVAIHPNNDPGSGGIRRMLEEMGTDARLIIRRDVARSHFLGLMRNAAVMVGNSSAGIIEAASFHTPVVDVGPRQRGRECGLNVVHVGYGTRNIAAALAELWDGNRFTRSRWANVYGGAGAGERIAKALGRVKIDDDRLGRKLITY